MTRAGHTRIAPAALKHTVEAVAAGAFGVPPGQVAAALDDDAGKLGVALTVRLPAPALLERGLVATHRHSAFEQAHIARLKVSVVCRQITGMELGRINIRLAAAKRRQVPDSRVDSGSAAPGSASRRADDTAVDTELLERR